MKHTKYIVGGLILLTIAFIFHGGVAAEGFKDGEKKLKGVILQPLGGLGNQLYVYAAGIIIKRTLGVPVFLLPHVSNVHTSRDYRDYMTYCEPIDPSDRRVKSAVVIPHLQSGITSPWTPDMIPGNYDRYILYPAPNFYQHYASIRDSIPIIRDTFIKHLETMYKNITINSSVSAFIHVRRGDYLNPENEQYALKFPYYQRGLDLLNKAKTVQRIYIVSDDVPWCKNQGWKTTKNILYFDDPDELKTLYLMTQCKQGAIMSNSTFSTWGAALGAGSESNSVVAYPSKWIFNLHMEFPPSWIKIQIE
jgi:Glycosyl transferase family 11